VAALEKAGIMPSMSRRGNCLDNAPMESFFHTLKTELVHHRHYGTHDQARRDVFAYIEGFYNRKRLHSALGYRTPQEIELRAA
jgi:putative transposase